MRTKRGPGATLLEAARQYRTPEEADTFGGFMQNQGSLSTATGFVLVFVRVFVRVYVRYFARVLKVVPLSVPLFVPVTCSSLSVLLFLLPPPLPASSSSSSLCLVS